MSGYLTHDLGIGDWGLGIGESVGSVGSVGSVESVGGWGRPNYQLLITHYLLLVTHYSLRPR
ncbi:hypothetical protein [Mastigocoleus sp. MO_188.B34]|uniref:hypothetical protein n=1 Tax=Mastigocoleus sp. MO_188.B34 TaxID=3036635 RepID=UPI00261646E1|nr:hypothetical protein [Mastigocoleus sp. MO_188.B34]MDJ0695156.1 hypothetical protein [Mastigocoleus sp. MO_188.B34]